MIGCSHGEIGDARNSVPVQMYCVCVCVCVHATRCASEALSVCVRACPGVGLSAAGVSPPVAVRAGA